MSRTKIFVCLKCLLVSIIFTSCGGSTGRRSYHSMPSDANTGGLYDASTDMPGCTPCPCCCARFDGGDDGGDLPPENEKLCAQCLSDPITFPCTSLQ